MRRRGAARRTVRQTARRRIGVGLLGAAAVGGAGYFAGKKIAEGRQAQTMQDQQIAELQDQVAYQQDAAYPPPQPAPTPAAGADSDMVTQLQELAQLHAAGVLSDDEFAAAKQKVLVGEQS